MKKPHIATILDNKI